MTKDGTLTSNRRRANHNSLTSPFLPIEIDPLVSTAGKVDHYSLTEYLFFFWTKNKICRNSDEVRNNKYDFILNTNTTVMETSLFFEHFDFFSASFCYINLSSRHGRQHRHSYQSRSSTLS